MMGLFRSQGNAVVFVGTGTPVATQVGDQWNDTNSTPALPKVWNGTAWVASASSQANITVGGISDTLENFTLEK